MKRDRLRKLSPRRKSKQAEKDTAPTHATQVESKDGKDNEEEDGDDLEQGIGGRGGHTRYGIIYVLSDNINF